MIRWGLLSAIVAVLALPGPAAAQAGGRSDAVPDETARPPSSPDLEDFKKGLSPHGEWIESPSGPVWRPRVAAGWRPYYDGHWAWTTQGWFWVSGEPWAWATYHYGRWTYDAVLGWIWVPGYEWAPAWVTWRVGAGVVGWAPLFPAFPVFATVHPSFFFAWTFVPAVKFVGFPVVRVAFAPVFVRRFFFVTHPVFVTHSAPSRRVFHGIAPPPRGGAPHRLAPPASGFRGGFAPPPRFRSRHR